MKRYQSLIFLVATTLFACLAFYFLFVAMIFSWNSLNWLFISLYLLVIVLLFFYKNRRKLLLVSCVVLYAIHVILLLFTSFPVCSFNGGMNDDYFFPIYSCDCTGFIKNNPFAGGECIGKRSACYIKNSKIEDYKPIECKEVDAALRSGK